MPRSLRGLRALSDISDQYGLDGFGFRVEQGEFYAEAGEVLTLTHGSQKVILLSG